jgi:hypothetical protein
MVFFWALEYILIAIAIVVLFGSMGIHGFCLKLEVSALRLGSMTTAFKILNICSFVSL